MVGVAGGAFCLSPSKACARLYTDQMTTRFLKAFPSTDPLWSARAFAQVRGTYRRHQQSAVLNASLARCTDAALQDHLLAVLLRGPLPAHKVR